MNIQLPSADHEGHVINFDVWAKRKILLTCG